MPPTMPPMMLPTIPLTIPPTIPPMMLPKIPPMMLTTMLPTMLPTMFGKAAERRRGQSTSANHFSPARHSPSVPCVDKKVRTGKVREGNAFDYRNLSKE